MIVECFSDSLKNFIETLIGKVQEDGLAFLQDLEMFKVTLHEFKQSYENTLKQDPSEVVEEYTDELMDLDGNDPRTVSEFVNQLKEDCFEEFKRFLLEEDNRVTYETRFVGNLEFAQAQQITKDCQRFFELIKPAPNVNLVNRFIPLDRKSVV